MQFFDILRKHDRRLKENGWHFVADRVHSNETTWLSLMSEAVTILPADWSSCLESIVERVHWRSMTPCTTNEIDLPNRNTAESKKIYCSIFYGKATHKAFSRHDRWTVVDQRSSDECATDNGSRMRATSSWYSLLKANMRSIIVEDECIFLTKVNVRNEDMQNPIFISDTWRCIFIDLSLSFTCNWRNVRRGQWWCRHDG
jgi:hypothetical protein